MANFQLSLMILQERRKRAQTQAHGDAGAAVGALIRQPALPACT
jgi:hypothetical protein